MTSRPCEVRDCSGLRDGWSLYCPSHDKVNERTGSPVGTSVRRVEVRPYRELVNDTLDMNIGHASVVAAVEIVAHRFRTAEFRAPRKGLHPRFRAANLFFQLRTKGVRPFDVFATVAAVYLMREYDPRRFPSDRHFQHQLVKAVYDLAPYVRPDRPHQSAGASLTVGLREYLSREFLEAFGVLPLALAKSIAAHRIPKPDPEPPPSEPGPPPVRGELAPFHHQQPES